MPTIDKPEVRDSDDVRNARRFLYLVVLLQETGVDPNKVPQAELIARVMTPFEKLGYTSIDIESWVTACDPEIKPPWDEVECFRAKVKKALRPRMSLSVPVAAAAVIAFSAAFSLARRRS